MTRTPFAVRRQLHLAVSWYGEDHNFYRKNLNAYGELVNGPGTLVQTIDGIYHASARSFVELINNEGASVKSKVSKGIVCDADNTLTIRQGDYTEIEGTTFHITTVEPILYGSEAVGYEISLEELVEGVDAV